MTNPKRIVYQTGLITIGTFRCGPDDDAFEDSGPSDSDCFVFPRTAVVIHHDHERPFVANPNVVTFYNLGDHYRRAAIAGDADRCEWFAVERQVALDVVRSRAACAGDGLEPPFRFTHGRSDPLSYALQRQLFLFVSEDPASVEPLGVEEAVVWLLDRVLHSTKDEAGRTESRHASRRRIDLVHDAKTVLSTEFTRGLSLAEIAARLDVSVFHLCRVFQRLAGCTLHEYRHQLRLRWSLEQLVERPRRTLVQCALDAGFSSHSHYGAAFKKAFGQTPSEFLDAAIGGDPTRSANDRVSRLLSRTRM
jgi:AraC-like DNA-binding protein